MRLNVGGLLWLCKSMVVAVGVWPLICHRLTRCVWCFGVKVL